MGCGAWHESDFKTYSKSLDRSVTSRGVADIKSMDARQVYTQSSIHKDMIPLNVVRECVETAEHPNTIPVILALDVTGSMGDTAVEVAAELNTMMQELLKTMSDVEFCIMGIGDFDYDDSPLQVSQFESDIRIAKSVDQIWFEAGGGPNEYESYIAAWAFAATQTKLDCWKRGRKGIIITLGDETFSPRIDRRSYNSETGHGDDFGGNGENITAESIYNAVKDKYDLYHIDVDHRGYHPNLSGFKRYCGENHVFSCEVKAIPQILADIIRSRETDVKFNTEDSIAASPITFGEISW